MPRPALPLLLALLSTLLLAGCSGSASATAELGPEVRLEPAVGTDGVTWRGATTWRAPASWTAIDASSRPFVAAEYALPGDSAEAPARCLMRNGSAPEGSEVDAEDAAKDARRFSDLKSADGESLRKEVDVETIELGGTRWVRGSIEGHFYDDGTFLDPRDPPLIVENYRGESAVPLLPGPPFVVRCEAPPATMDAELAGFEAWLESIRIAPVAP